MVPVPPETGIDPSSENRHACRSSAVKPARMASSRVQLLSRELLWRHDMITFEAKCKCQMHMPNAHGHMHVMYPSQQETKSIAQSVEPVDESKTALTRAESEVLASDHRHGYRRLPLHGVTFFFSSNSSTRNKPRATRKRSAFCCRLRGQEGLCEPSAWTCAQPIKYPFHSQSQRRIVN